MSKSRQCRGYVLNGLTRWSKDDLIQVIEIPGNYEVKVDRWYYDKNCLYDWKMNGSGYAHRVNKEDKTVWMHRDVLGVSSSQCDLVVDHIDGDTFNNCESNLRLCTQAENSYNRKKAEGTSSSFKGVRKVRGKWEVSIRKDGVTVNLGSHDDEVTAALIYDSAAVYLFEEFARINFPKHKEKLLEEVIVMHN